MAASSFEEATKFVKTLRSLDNDTKLKFYGMYKQATEGPCTAPKPSFFEMTACAKWQAWKNMGNIDSDLAKQMYFSIWF